MRLKNDGLRLSAQPCSELCSLCGVVVHHSVVIEFDTRLHHKRDDATPDTRKVLLENFLMDCDGVGCRLNRGYGKIMHGVRGPTWNRDLRTDNVHRPISRCVCGLGR